MDSAVEGAHHRQANNSISTSSGNESATGAPMGNLTVQPAPLWTQDPVWKQHVASLVDFPSNLSVLELCAGTGAASLALGLLLGPKKARLAGAWDIDGNLQGIYDAVHGRGAPVHLGKQDGDILGTPLTDFPDANILVAGPPCPLFLRVESGWRWRTPEHALLSAASRCLQSWTPGHKSSHRAAEQPGTA